jgi:hypothetical protein
MVPTANQGCWCKRLFYKRGCQGTFFSLHRRRGYFPRHPAPLTIEELVWCRAPGLGLRCSISAGSSSGLRRRRRFLKLGKRCGCTVSTMVLSEARGLVLFRVVRGGIGFTQRLGARHHAPTGVSHTHPRTRASPEPTSHHQEKISEMEGALHPRRSSGLRF